MRRTYPTSAEVRNEPRLGQRSGMSPGAGSSSRSRGGNRASTECPSVVAGQDNKGWSLYGAPWLQPVAISGKSTSRRTRQNKPKPLPWAATGCLRSSMVSRASAVGCHTRCGRSPPLRGRGSTPTRDGCLFLTAAARTRALVATAAGACLADHEEILSRPRLRSR